MSAKAVNPVAVLGAGAWGTALAILLARNGHPTWLWGHEPDYLAELAARRENTLALPGVAFPEALHPTPDLATALGAATDVLVVVPSHVFTEVLRIIEPQLQAGTRLAWATKGLEATGARLLHEVAAEILGPRVPTAVISGPTFAREVAKGLPTAVTVASRDASFAGDLAALLHSERFRVYVSGDLVGVQLGGSVKNVLAIAAGIADGLGFGANTRAALITRGLAEMTRLGVTLGGQRDTFMGLAGLGDLVLTCTDDQSRNRRMGLALAKGLGVEAAEAAIGQVVEGVGTARVVARLARRHRVDMPICLEVEQVLAGGLTPTDAVRSLLAREDGREERI